MVAKRLCTAVVLLVLSSVALTACGKRGDLVAPGNQPYPQQYPKQ